MDGQGKGIGKGERGAEEGMRLKWLDFPCLLEHEMSCMDGMR
jgi:hypothetical protein